MTKFVSQEDFEHYKNIRTANALLQVMMRYRLLGRIARKRMNNGDFTNTPSKKKQSDKKE